MIAPLTFDHSLRPFLPQLAQFQTTRDLERSSLYGKLRPDIERLLGRVWEEDLADAESPPRPSATPPQRGGLSEPADPLFFQRERPKADFKVPPFEEGWPKAGGIRAVAWNIERGIRLDGIIRLLQEHPAMKSADILLLSELDWGMARTGNRFVAREMAAALGMNYAFAPCYLALNKGSGVEKSVAGENEESLHGNALLSRYPMHRAHSLALPNGKDKMKGAEKRIGSQRAVIADVAHPLGMFRAAEMHLDAHSSQQHRRLQMRLVLDHLETLTPALPVLIGGDWNTTTHNASRALYSILGYFRRVAMGVRHVVAKHYPYPDRWFERRLFGELERRGYDYRNLNKPGECTLHYNVSDIATNLNLAEWVPQWCFAFVNWALERTGGRCSMKLDWFAGKGIRQTSEPAAIQGLTDSGKPVSDHDPIVLSFIPSKVK